MTKEELINVSKNMVKEYYNRYMDVSKQITIDDIEVIGYHNSPTSMWLELAVSGSDGIKYEISYTKKSKQIHSYIHDKNGEETFKKRMVNVWAQ